MRTPLSLTAIALVGFVIGACAVSTSSPDPTSDSDAEDLTAAKDAVLIKNAETR